MRSFFCLATLFILSTTTNAFSLSNSESRAVDRRAFLGAAALIAVATPAMAIDDLAMPTEEESRLSDEVCLSIVCDCWKLFSLYFVPFPPVTRLFRR